MIIFCPIVLKKFAKFNENTVPFRLENHDQIGDRSIPDSDNNQQSPNIVKGEAPE